ncbi:hypothetical protein T10_2115 [Trichinella papuae]|uniref:Retrotransposon gag domain-containing protein n=1 Tax=Trichinella papuae TaxID=268474 RepID=A0A0V1MUA8_9BILA|nr:hypothetical protein T10_2115 [Trichinella papuae]
MEQRKSENADDTKQETRELELDLELLELELEIEFEFELLESLLINFISPRFYSSIARSSTYEDAIQSLKSIFEKPVNEIYARHLLATRKQLQGESLDEFLRELNALCVGSGLKLQGCYSSSVPRRAFTRRFRSSCENYYESCSLPETVAATANDEDNERLSESPGVVVIARNPSCFFCGRSKHPRFQCLQREATCISSSPAALLSTTTSATLASVGSTFPHFLAKAVVEILLFRKEINCLIDSGSSESFIHPEVVERLGLKIIPSSEPVGMALSAFSIKALRQG